MTTWVGAGRVLRPAPFGCAPVQGARGLHRRGPPSATILVVSDVVPDRHLEGPVKHRRIAQSLRALGGGRLPETIDLPAGRYRLARTVKHDFFAATGFYDGPHARRAVVKLGRTAPFAGMPLEWIGRYLCRRELRFYGSLADLPSVPRVLGTVGPTGFAHEYVQGRPLERGKAVPDGFFAQLQQLLAELHRRQIAYVDTNKPQNILLGDNGRPYLIDFQISWDLNELGNNVLNRWLLRRLQRADIYHILKHKRRMRPDELQPGERDLAVRRGALIRLHRIVAWPYFRVRRRLMAKLRDRGALLPEGSK